jgi:hypothetical protein
VAVEEPIEGRWKAGLDNGRYTREQGLLWVRLAEKATGQTFLSATDAEVLGSVDKAPRSLTEAISAIVTADVLGRRSVACHAAPVGVQAGVGEVQTHTPFSDSYDGR